MRLPVTFAEATLGADVKVPTLDGQVTMRIPPGTPSGKVMRVRGQGVQADGEAARPATCSSRSTCWCPIDAQRASSARRSRRSPTVLDDDPRAALFEKTQDRRKSDGG